MRTLTIRMVVLLTCGVTLGTSDVRPVQAGVIPWTYNAIFGYGPMFPRRYGYTAGYAPGYGMPGMWGAGYGYGYQSSPLAYSAPVTTYYGPSYYGGGSVYDMSSACGCNPCATSACSPCGSGCATGDCSTTGGNYSPSPVAEDRNDSEITPTFKPTTPNENNTPDPNDDFVPVERREDDFIRPRENNTPGDNRSTIPGAGSTIPGNNSTIPDTSRSTIPDSRSTIPGNPANGSSTIPGEAGPAPMSPIDRPMAPEFNGSSTIPGGSRSTIPDASRSTIPPGNSESTIPDSRRFPETNDTTFPPPISRPAPTEPGNGEVTPLLPNTEVRPLEIEDAPIASLVVERQRVIMRAGYRSPQIARPEVPAQPVYEAGTSKLAIR